MGVGLLFSAITGGVTAAGFSAAGGYGFCHAFLAYELGGLLSAMLFIAVVNGYQGQAAR